MTQNLFLGHNKNHATDSVPVLQVELRVHDVLKLISIARRWYGGGKPYRGTPVAVGHVSCSLRLVVMRESSTGCLEGLVRGGEGGPRLPVSLFTHYHERGIQAAVTKTLKVSNYPHFHWPYIYIPVSLFLSLILLSLFLIIALPFCFWLRELFYSIITVRVTCNYILIVSHCIILRGVVTRASSEWWVWFMWSTSDRRGGETGSVSPSSSGLHHQESWWWAGPPGGDGRRWRGSVGRGCELP